MADFLNQILRQGAPGGGSGICCQMLWVTSAHDRGVAVGVRKRVSQNQFGGRHVGGQEFSQTGFLPNLIQRGPLNFGVGASLGNTAAEDDPSPLLCRRTDCLVMLRGKA